MARDGSGVRIVSASSLEITFIYEGKRCRERVQLEPTKENIKKAELFKQEIDIAIKRGTFHYPTSFPHSPRARKFLTSAQQKGLLTLKEYIELWLDQKKQALHSSTLSGYRKVFNNLIYPALGHYRLTEITRPLVRDWISQQKVSNKTIRNRLSPLRAALQDAVYDGFIEINPLFEWTWRNREITNNKPKHDPFTKLEMEQILSHAEGQARNFIAFWLWTGMRPSELIALDWSDVNLTLGTITINKALTDAAIAPEPTKTNSSTRVLKLLPPALEVIKNQREFTYLKHKEVFQNPKNRERWTGAQQIRRTMWIPIMEKAGVRYRYPYQLRHTFASMMYSSREHRGWLSKYLGHADETVTLKTYAKWLSEADENAGMKAVAIFGNDSINDSVK